ncbi:FAD binding domain-containing protein [Hyphomicrobium facile]|uniref:Carbon-monoxide dehydrogenase medium subunit n=1 Tax=Hyphomicrobium facile TaxID=51670 RepID=A0A1I7MXB5_9HYPH|nr:xanthine dehydrogenase family protein subunit M [Hyphomicrobium facile]SFV27063.1 carbon-monoxide dehydrogenase medium subunit [Hyphomicrobium facile]
MKARTFSFRRVTSVEEALAAFASCEGEARFLAGGQSLLPALNLRLDAPDLLIDISRVEGMRGVSVSSSGLRIGALTRHVEVLRSPLVAEHASLLSRAAPFVAHPAIRNLGTIGGSLALADPAAEFPTCILALNASLEIAGANGIRTVRADDYFRALYETDIGPGELLTAILIPPPSHGQRVHFDELARRRGDYAIVGLAVNAVIHDSNVKEIRLAFSSVGPIPTRAKTAEAQLIGTFLGAEGIASAQAALANDLSPDGTDEVSSETRMHLARVLLGRSLNALLREDK